LSPDFIVQDGVVPRQRLGEALRRIGEMSRASGLRVANVFHAGDGNLHPLILYNGREGGALARAEELAGRILRMCVEMGGSLTGEHGIGMEKRDYLPDMFSAAEIDLMQRLRAAFDPLGISNPGKMFPGGDAPALVQHGLHPLEAAGLLSRE
jgi:glycolate oxidase